jgi:hypothetical protein
MNIAKGTSFSPQKKPIWQLRDLKFKKTGSYGYIGSQIQKPHCQTSHKQF